MVFDEYIKIFKEVLAITEKIEALCAKERSEEAEPLFHERNALIQKLSVPEDIDEEKFAIILSVKEKISKLNEKILKDMEKGKDKFHKEAKKIRESLPESRPTFRETNEIQLENKYKSPKHNDGGSIFS